MTSTQDQEQSLGAFIGGFLVSTLVVGMLLVVLEALYWVIFGYFYEFSFTASNPLFRLLIAVWIIFAFVIWWKT